MSDKIEQFIQAAEALGIEVHCEPDWDEDGNILITFLNVFDSEDNWETILVSPDGHVVTGF
jgi:hypothetical protein